MRPVRNSGSNTSEYHRMQGLAECTEKRMHQASVSYHSFDMNDDVEFDFSYMYVWRLAGAMQVVVQSKA